jgi:hypothetical protein
LSLKAFPLGVVRAWQTLLEFFLQIHDPTTRNRQGIDVGTPFQRLPTRQLQS